MAQNITRSSNDIVKDALAAIPTISVEDALPLVGSHTHVFVGLRDGAEQTKSGIIPGAVATSRGMMEFHIDLESPAHKPAFNLDKTYFSVPLAGALHLPPKSPLRWACHLL